MLWGPLALLAGLWLLAGLACARVLYWRGHEGRHWMLIGALAGPLAILLVADQARFVEPQAEPVVLGPAAPRRDGITVVVPAAAVGTLGARALDRLGLPVSRVAVVTPVAFERVPRASWDTVEPQVRATLAEATQRFAPYPVELVALPGRAPEAISSWAADHSPAVIITTRGAHLPRAIGRLARLGAAQPGVSTVVFDPAASTAAASRRRVA